MKKIIIVLIFLFVGAFLLQSNEVSNETKMDYLITVDFEDDDFPVLVNL